MTRLGGWLLLFFAVVIGGFALIVKHGASPHDGDDRVEVIDVDGPAVPVAGVQRADLRDTWGQPRADGGRVHHALDIMAPRGTAVLAAASGHVEKLFDSRDGGRTVYVRREDPDWVDYYAHLDAYAAGLREGAAVRMGQQIGTVGSSGDADPGAPHLHYEIKHMAPGERWWQGKEVNPFSILAGATGG